MAVASLSDQALWRSAGGVNPVSGADLGGPDSNADQFLLNDLLLSHLLPSNGFVALHLTARPNHPRHETRPRWGQFHLRSRAGPVDPISLAHTSRNRCLGRLRRGESRDGPRVAAGQQAL